MLCLAAILFWSGSDSVDTRYFCYELETNFSDLFFCVVYQFPALVVGHKTLLAIQNTF